MLIYKVNKGRIYASKNERETVVSLMNCVLHQPLQEEPNLEIKQRQTKKGS